MSTSLDLYVSLDSPWWMPLTRFVPFWLLLVLDRLVRPAWVRLDVHHFFLYESWWFYVEVPVELVFLASWLVNWWLVAFTWWWTGWFMVYFLVLLVTFLVFLLRWIHAVLAWCLDFLFFGLYTLCGVGSGVSSFLTRLGCSLGRLCLVVKFAEPQRLLWVFVKTLTRGLWVLLKTLISTSCTLVVEIVYLPFDLVRLLLGAWALTAVRFDGGNVLVRGGPGLWFRVGSVTRRYRFRNPWLVVLCLLGLAVSFGFPVIRWTLLLRHAAVPWLFEGAVYKYRLRLGFLPNPLPVLVVSALRGFYLGALFSYVELDTFALAVADLEHGDDNRPASVREWEALARGKALADVEGVALVAACGTAGAVPRLRPRGRLACRLGAALGGARGVAGSFIRGRWTPDLPSADRSPMLNALLAVSREELKVLGVGTFPTRTGLDGDYVLVESREGERRLVIPNLLGRLSTYAALRARDEDLLLGLRARAVTWLKEVGAPAWVAPLCLSSSVADAFEVSTLEENAWARLRGTLAAERLVGF
jgi:hypothetical protein